LNYNNIKPFYTTKKMLLALSIAFFSKSSAGAPPVTLNTKEQRLGMNPDISRFVLPLCTTINMNGCAAFIFATVIFLMQNQGIPITLSMNERSSARVGLTVEITITPPQAPMQRIVDHKTGFGPIVA
jgi:Na+/H+-dicarboxylate symporter